MAPVTLRYVQIITSRGRQYGYYRRAGFRFRLPGAPGSQEFLAAYQARHAAWATEPAERHMLLHGSLGALIALYRASPDWQQLKPSSRRDYEKFLAPLADRYGHCPVATLERHHVRQIRDAYATRPPAKPDDEPIPSPRRANKIIGVLSILMSFAIDQGWRVTNPAARPKRLKTGAGYRAWTVEELRRFVNTAPDFALACLLAVATGQRGGDLVRMTWRAYDGSAIEVIQEKTGTPLWIPCHTSLRAALDRAPRTAMTILCRADGAPWTALQFQTAASKAIRGAGLRGLVWHGLRHTAATWLAEAGCSEREIMSITGHSSPAMVSRYARHADQKTRATAAIAKLERGRENDHGTASVKHGPAKCKTSPPE